MSIVQREWPGEASLRRWPFNPTRRKRERVMELLERTFQRRRRARADAKGWQGLAGSTEY